MPQSAPSSLPWRTVVSNMNLPARFPRTTAVAETNMTEEDPYLCVGVCMADPDSGYCLGCGRPPLPAPVDAVVVEAVSPPVEAIAPRDPDSPEA